VNEISYAKHALIVAALIINLWFGGDLVQEFVGGFARTVFEITLILGWMTLILGMRAPLPWRRREEDEAEQDRRDT